jgi:hypothetical protein
VAWRYIQEGIAKAEVELGFKLICAVRLRGERESFDKAFEAYRQREEAKLLHDAFEPLRANDPQFASECGGYQGESTPETVGEKHGL